MALNECLVYDLNLAISNDSVDILRHLYKPEFAESLFRFAANRNANKCLYWMFDVMKVTPDRSAMISIIISNNVELVKHLLINGVKLPDDAVSFAIHAIEMLKFILSRGGDPNCKSQRCGFESVLNEVISLVDGRNLGVSTVNYTEIARHLIEAGARISVVYWGVFFVIKIKQNMATKKKHCRSAIIALFFTLKSYGVPRDLIRLMAKRISWKNECWLK